MDQRSRILVVEPNRTNLSVLAPRLTEAGFQVVTADSGRAAVGELHRGRIDLVIAELHMERIDGAELARIIRDEVMWRELPVMLITGRSEPEGAVKAYQSGADDVILKPFHFEVLIARIERRLARARSVETLRGDYAALDARIVSRAIEIGEMRQRLFDSEADRRRLQMLVASKAA
jgi:DNA-binding response OmpR family regulator